MAGLYSRSGLDRAMRTWIVRVSGLTRSATYSMVPSRLPLRSAGMSRCTRCPRRSSRASCSGTSATAQIESRLEMVNSSWVGSTTCPIAALRSTMVPDLVAVIGVLATS